MKDAKRALTPKAPIQSKIQEKPTAQNKEVISFGSVTLGTMLSPHPVVPPTPRQNGGHLGYIFLNLVYNSFFECFHHDDLPQIGLLIFFSWH